mgnify:CR=1 FL=1
MDKDVDIVIVGRSVDSALALGPLIHEFKWKPDQLNMLSSGTICGHLLECGAQVTGAYFADPGYKDVPDLYNVGFPIAEFHENGEFYITKPKNTGGLVNKATVTEQLLYETHNPNQYIVPDVIADMSQLDLIEYDNKVLVRGGIGHNKPNNLKATICSESGYMGEAEMSYAGPNAFLRAKLAIEVIENLDRKSKKIVFLSNAPRPSSKVINFLLKLKMDKKYLTNVMTSGEAAMYAINKNQFGKTFFHLGPPRDNSVFEKVKNNQVNLESCDFILCTGLFDEHENDLNSVSYTHLTLPTKRIV